MTTAKNLLVKVPAITALFWMIKILSTTVGETVADAVNTVFTDQLKFSDAKASIAVTALSTVLLALALVFQFRAAKYRPARYWIVAVLISVVGTLVTDDLHDILGVPLWIETVVFGLGLTTIFMVWFSSEKTLAMKSINTPKREAFYWLAILFTFALGTAVGDWMSEALNLGYLFAFIIFAMLILTVSAIYKAGVFSGVATFWVVYILTRPLGASLGDLLSQNHKNGGMQLGMNRVSAVFLALILIAVAYLQISHRDELSADSKSA